MTHNPATPLKKRPASDTTGKNILIVRLSAHGDVIQTLPLLAAIKRNNPNHKVGWLIEASAAGLLDNHPLIDNLHVCHRKRWFQTLKNSPWRWFQIVKEIRLFIKEINAQNYELSFDAQGLLKSALWPWLSSIPFRSGYRRTRENAAIFYNQPVSYHHLTKPDLPAAQKFMEFMDFLETNPLPLTDRPIAFPLPETNPTEQNRLKTLSESLDDSKPTLAIGPTTRWASKTWPLSHWKNIFEAIQHWPINIVLLGGPEDAEWHQQLWPDNVLPDNIFDWIGQTQWPELYELFKQVDVYLGMDSALLHIANAVSFNTIHHNPQIIGLFGPTAPGRTGPVNSSQAKHTTITTQLDCQPCFKKHCPLKTNQCMADLSPKEVLQQLETNLNLLSQTKQ